MTKAGLKSVSANLLVILIIFTAITYSYQIEVISKEDAHAQKTDYFDYITSSNKVSSSANACSSNSCGRDDNKQEHRLLATNYTNIISIVNPDLIVTPNSSSVNSTYILGKTIEMAVFNISALEAAIITIDLRFLQNTMVHGTDWELVFLVSPNTLTPGVVDSNSQIQLPDTFLKLDDKFTTNQFIFQAQNDIQFAVYAEILNPIYLFSEYMFLNITSVETIAPYRAIPVINNASEYQLYSFAAVIFQSSQISMPVNVPDYDSNNNYPNYYMDLALANDTDLSLHTLDSTNTFNPTDLFWSQIGSSNIMTPYLPFFSNCRGYGKYIPIFTIFEQHPNCVLQKEGNVVPTNPLGFGSSPVADRCDDIVIDCIYDEGFNNPSDLTPWYSATSGPVFYMTPYPISANDMQQTAALNTQNFVAVTVTNTTAVANQYPTIVQLTFEYYQVTDTMKEMIRAYIAFDGYENATADQLAQNATFGYELTISFVPMSHTKLLIAFAFGTDVYLITFIAVGIVACTVMVVIFSGL